MRSQQPLWWCAVACAGIVFIGSFTARTTRTYGDRDTQPSTVISEANVQMTGEPGAEPFTIATEAGTRWNFWGVLLGLVALVTLAIGRRWQVRRRVVSASTAFIATFALSLVAMRAGQHWLHLVEERGRSREYILAISPGLPYVTIFAIVGSTLTFAVAVSWIWPNCSALVRRPLSTDWTAPPIANHGESQLLWMGGRLAARWRSTTWDADEPSAGSSSGRRCARS